MVISRSGYSAISGPVANIAVAASAAVTIGKVLIGFLPVDLV